MDKILHKGIDKKILSKIDMYLNDIHSIQSTYIRYLFGSKELKGVCGKVIRGDKYYGYIVSPNMLTVYEYIVRLRCRSFLDLGCGMNVLGGILEMLHKKFGNGFEFYSDESNFVRQCDTTIHFGGIDNNKELLSVAKKLYVNQRYWLRDLLELEKKDITYRFGDYYPEFSKEKLVGRYDILYLYEPIYDYVIADRFVKHLTSLLDSGQIVMCNWWGAGAVDNCFSDSEEYEKLDTKNSISVYRKK